MTKKFSTREETSPKITLRKGKKELWKGLSDLQEEVMQEDREHLQEPVLLVLMLSTLTSTTWSRVASPW